MARYWSDQHGTFLEAQVVWNGIGPSPGELHTRQMWQQREAPIFGKPKSGDHITQREARGKAKADLPFGFIAYQRQSSRPKPPIQVTKAHCRSCTQRFPITELSAKLRLCPTCKPLPPKALKGKAA